jgi:hypothetical protein
MRIARPAANPGEIFRAGARVLLAVVAALVAYAYWIRGWAGAWSVMATMLHPAMTLGLVPLAFLLGTLRQAAIAVARALIRSDHSSG